MTELHITSGDFNTLVHHLLTTLHKSEGNTHPHHSPLHSSFPYLVLSDLAVAGYLITLGTPESVNWKPASCGTAQP